MASTWATWVAARIWKAEQTLQQAQRELRRGTDAARKKYAEAVAEMDATYALGMVEQRKEDSGSGLFPDPAHSSG